jgi:hypothetical protein
VVANGVGGLSPPYPPSIKLNSSFDNEKENPHLYLSPKKSRLSPKTLFFELLDIFKITSTVRDFSLFFFGMRRRGVWRNPRFPHLYLINRYV